MQMLYGLVVAFWLGMILHFLATRAMEEDLWTMVVFFTPIGAVIYFFGYFLPNVRHSSTQVRHRQLRFLQATPKDQLTADNLRQLGDYHREAGRWSESLEYYHSASPRYPGHHAIQLGIAECLIELKRPKEAIPDLRTIYEHDRLYQEQAGALLFRALTAPGAEASLEDMRLLAQGTRSAEIKYGYAEQLRQAGQTSQAKQILQAMVAQGATGGAYRADRPWHCKAKKLLKQCR
ncbi:MAG: hypothetical protein HYZ92_00830 [Candidatus Omnitrophica bacterium]|nr:hypothetical protein [Candidatus Omnitrophota bacterium]